MVLCLASLMFVVLRPRFLMPGACLAVINIVLADRYRCVLELMLDAFSTEMDSSTLLLVDATVPALVLNRNSIFRDLSRVWTVVVILLLLCGRNLLSRRSMAIVALKLVNTEVNLSLTNLVLTTISCRGSLLMLTRLASAHMFGAA